MRHAYKKPQIAVVGGGTGLSVLLRGMKKEEYQLTAVVTVADDGGNSGTLREDLGMLPPGDVRSCLLALADEENAMQEILRYRFREGRLKGQNVGNLMIAALYDIYGSFEEAVARISDILKVQGKVLPVANMEMQLGAELFNGNLVLGESQIARVALAEASPIQRLFLTPPDAAASEAACRAVLTADAVLIGPGSLYTSILPNFLLENLSEALANAKGRRIYICNVMTQPGETDGYGVREHVDALQTYIGRGRIEYAVVNNRALDAETLAPYGKDGARQVLPNAADRVYLRDNGIVLIENDFIETKKGYIRHDAAGIADVLAQIMSE
jgi:uncharacterized cofD-like protein